MELIDQVDPFIATGGMGFTQGSASPAATVPGGMVKVGPDTSMESAPLSFSHCSGYWYEDTYVVAFSHTRLHGTGAADGGAIGIAPTLEPTIDWKAYRSQLDHDLEEARPGYYAISLPEADVELTATTRAAYHRYDFRGETGWLTLDLGHTGADHQVSESWMTVDEANARIEGFVLMQGALSSRTGGQPTYFVLESSTPFSEIQLWRDDEAVEGTLAMGTRVAATLQIEDQTELRVGISAVDLRGARQNLADEIPEWSFDAVHERARSQWSEAFSAIEVSGGTESQKTQFASALYHALLMPTVFMDTDGRYRGGDAEVHQAIGWTYYTDFSLWDTYRTLHPLMQLVWPHLALDHARSLTDMAEKREGFPTWPQGVGDGRSMLGHAAELVVAETFVKGIQDFDVETAFYWADRQANDTELHHSRENLGLSLNYGYIPADLAGESVAKTLEYGIDDAAIALLADALGMEEEAQAYADRAQAYRLVFDTETGFHRGKLSTGEWAPLQEFGWGDHYTEGNAWQYAWLAPHDAAGLAEAFGSADLLMDKLDEFMDRGTDYVPDYVPPEFYWHGNEPDIHAPFLYAQLGRPESTDEWVRWIQENRYRTEPAGYSGNDDGGTLASWYAFSAIGLYPINGTDRYVLFPPLFDAVRIQSGDGWLEIVREGTGNQLQAIELGGEVLDGRVLRHGELLSAGHLRFIMADEN